LRTFRRTLSRPSSLRTWLVHRQRPESGRHGRVQVRTRPPIGRKQDAALRTGRSMVSRTTHLPVRGLRPCSSHGTRSSWATQLVHHLRFDGDVRLRPGLSAAGPIASRLSRGRHLVSGPAHLQVDPVRRAFGSVRRIGHRIRFHRPLDHQLPLRGRSSAGRPEDEQVPAVAHLVQSGAALCL
jgi:hypothetical protein